MDNNKRKYDLLGMPYGTANHQLRKMIMFRFIQNARVDFCYRCGKIIKNIDDLSIEHMNPWQQAENPKEAFFNLDNIAFSHLKCNVDASNRKGIPHPNQRGEKSGTSKLKQQEVNKIKEKLSVGYSSKKLSEEYGVHKSTISLIKSNKVWKKT